MKLDWAPSGTLFHLFDTHTGEGAGIYRSARPGSTDFPGAWATPAELIRNGLRMAGDSSSLTK